MITRDDFEAWKTNPITRAIDQYLWDNAAEYRDEWSRGENWTPESRIQVATWEEMAELDYDTFAGFYERRQAEYEEERQRVLEEANEVKDE